MELIIRNCNFNDIIKIHDLSNTVIKTKFSIGRFKRILSKFPELCFVAVFKKETIGFITATLSDDNKRCIIFAMGVDNRFRKMGIGTNLLDRLISFLKNEKVEIISLHVRDSNTNAIKFYEHFGFHKVKKVNNFYSNGENAIEMILNVS